MKKTQKKEKKKNLWALFCGWVQCSKATKPLQGEDILFESILGPSSGFEHGTPGLGIQHLNYLTIVEVHWKTQFLGEGGVSWKKKYIGGFSKKWY